MRANESGSTSAAAFRNLYQSLDVMMSSGSNGLLVSRHQRAAVVGQYVMKVAEHEGLCCFMKLGSFDF